MALCRTQIEKKKKILIAVTFSPERGGFVGTARTAGDCA
jgi:hypothetical protein